MVGGAALESVLIPILRDLRNHLPRMVLIGGWVPQLHRRYGNGEGWSRDPVSTVELDLLLTDDASWEEREPLSNTLRKIGFRPVDRDSPPAVWERDVTLGERIEFFLDHSGPAVSVGTVVSPRRGAGVGGMSLEGLAFLREHAVELHIPLLPGKKAPETITVRVPSLPAFLVHKGAVFFRRGDGARKAKDILYIVEIMAEGDPLVRTIEEGILSLCQESPESASVPRTARNHLTLLLNRAPDAVLREVAEAFAARHGTSTVAATARTRGLLEDFLYAIPEDCGGGLREPGPGSAPETGPVRF